jgi:hypothetical protein
MAASHSGCDDQRCTGSSSGTTKLGLSLVLRRVTKITAKLRLNAECIAAERAALPKAAEWVKIGFEPASVQ